jgi:hypothetical protein
MIGVSAFIQNLPTNQYNMSGCHGSEKQNAQMPQSETSVLHVSSAICVNVLKLIKPH